ncbi:MAG: class I SAM-dependent methyltransferase [Promethearchaeota archaeon]
MSNEKNIKEFAEQQYKTSQNLNARMNLWSYGSNPVSLQKWIFSKIHLQEYERVLELGCGTGQLWLENFRIVPSNCSIILSDFSKEMVSKASSNLQSLNLPIEFEIIDAEEISYPDHTFDVVIACHMLYHIPNIHQALESINRIMKPESRFIATTVSKRHLQELKDFLSGFGLYSGEKIWVKHFSEFRNETGEEILKSFFSDIKFYEYINEVKIYSIDPVMKYIESMFSFEDLAIFKRKKVEIKEALINILEKESEFKITGICGLFEATSPIKIE